MFSVSILNSAVKMTLYPLLERGLDLHTLEEKIKKNCFKTCRKLYTKSECMLLQYSGAALVRDTDSIWLNQQLP